MHLLQYLIPFVLSISHFNLQTMKSLCCNAKTCHIEEHLDHTPTYEFRIVNNILMIKDYFIKNTINSNDRLMILLHTTDKTYGIPIKTYKPNVYTMIDIYRYYYNKNSDNSDNSDKNTFRVADIKKYYR